MTDYYKEPLTEEEYFQQFHQNTVESGLFTETIPSKTIAFLPSLDGVVEVGVGVDEQEAREDYLANLQGLLAELKEQEVKVMYDVVSLDYTCVKGDV